MHIKAIVDSPCQHTLDEIKDQDGKNLEAAISRRDIPMGRTGESLDKAGAYALQGEGRRFVERVEGSETNVIGLPIDETLALLEELGLTP